MSYLPAWTADPDGNPIQIVQPSNGSYLGHHPVATSQAAGPGSTGRKPEHMTRSQVIRSFVRPK